MDFIRRFTHPVVALALICLMAESTRAADGFKASPEKEQELIAVLRSEAPSGEKAIACKLLAVDGSSAAVPDLARLLPDPQLSSWARIALEAIPGEAADEALRNATASLEGRLLIGTINSIGVRRDVKAVDLLAERLKDQDADVASAAAVALGHIGNDAATKTLRAALTVKPTDVRSAVAEGCVLCAERLLFEGKSSDAAELYDEVRQADVPKQRIIEATRGAILARGDQGIPLLLEQFRSADKKMFQLALTTVREFPGGEVDKALAAELKNSSSERAALIVTAMADRPETVVLSAVLTAAENGSVEVRLAAVEALGRVGDASCVDTLLNAAIEGDEELSESAKSALAQLPSDKVDAQIATELPKAKGKRYLLLIELVGQRRIDAVNELLTALDHSEAEVRSAALAALGETVTLQRLSVLISQVVSPSHPEDAPAAEQALRSASVRMPEREKCAEQLAAALDRSPDATKTVLLEILSDVGGTRSLQTLSEAAKSNDPQLQDDGSRLLGKWNSVDAAPVLLDLAKTAPEGKYRVRALRGYLGLARKFAMPEKQRAEMCQQALDTAQQAAERQLALEVLQLHPSIEGLAVAIKAKQKAELKDAATQTTLVVAQKLGSKGIDVAPMLAKGGLEKVKLEIIKAQYGAGQTQKDVTDALRKQAGEYPLVTLSSNSYNQSFGGDPVPGSVKQLKIQYRINGKAGEASFAENALIILPAPK